MEIERDIARARERERERERKSGRESQSEGDLAQPITLGPK
jgi:hypothetical protein